MCNFSYVHCSFFFMYLPKRWRACVLLFGGQATPIRMLVRKMRFGFYLFSAVVILHRESYCNSCCDYCEFPKDEAMEHLLLHASCVCVCLCRYSAVPPPNLISALRPFDSFCSRDIYFWGCGFGGGPVGGISSLFTQGQKIKIIQIPIRETAMSPGYVHPCHRLR